MAIATNILQCLIPISQFNKGQASKIFDRLHDEKELIDFEEIISHQKLFCHQRNIQD